MCTLISRCTLVPKITYVGVNEAVEDLVLAGGLNPLGAQVFNKLWGVLTVILYYLGPYVVEVVHRAMK